MSVAALVAAGLAALGVSFLVQLGCFSVVLLVCLVFLRPRFARRLGAQGVPTRTEGLVGKVGHVTVAVGPISGAGRVEVVGQDWAAVSREPLAAGTPVLVEGSDGIVLVVRATDGEPQG